MLTKLTYANVVGTLALFVALGGIGYAATALPADSVGTKQLKNDAVTNSKLANGAVTGAKVAHGSLTGEQISSSTLGLVPNASHATNSDRLGGSSPSAFQSRVTGTCSGSAINQINSDGSVSCQPVGVFAYGQIREDASIRSSSSNVVSASGTPGYVEHPATGEYCVDFSSPPSQNEVESSVVGHAGSTNNPVFIYVTNGQEPFSCANSYALQIEILDISGKPTNARFSFIVP